MKNRYTKNLIHPEIGPIQISLAILFMIFVMEITNLSSNAVYSFVAKLNHEISCAGVYFCGCEIAKCLNTEPVIKVEKKPAPVTSSTMYRPEPLEKVEIKTAIKVLGKQSAKKVIQEKADSNSQTPFHPIIHKAAKQYEVEPAIIKAIIMAESSFNPKAVSYKGAQGLMQLMPKTARYLGVEDSFNPEHNIDGGVRYFKKLLDKFDGDVKLALAAYNAGSRNVQKYKGVPPFKATKVYIKKVLQYYETYKAA